MKRTTSRQPASTANEATVHAKLIQVLKEIIGLGQLLGADVVADLTPQRQRALTAAQAQMEIGRQTAAAERLKLKLKFPGLSSDQHEYLSAKLDYAEKRAQYERDRFRECIDWLKNAKAVIADATATTAEAESQSSIQPSSPQPPSLPQPTAEWPNEQRSETVPQSSITKDKRDKRRFPNRARWLKTEMDRRDIKTPHALQELSRDADAANGVHHETIQRILDGLSVRESSLKKIIQGLNEAGIRLRLPTLTIANIPGD